ncbi:hypothetical protein SUGI_1175460 [Cryptomeria japonica]|nr:hypothetical protein SUGI_1175460 [Cryptomeria japonica]
MSLRPNGRIEARKKMGYKVSVDKEEGRRKREENMVEIRKNKREENLIKKRRGGIGDPLLSRLDTFSLWATAIMSQSVAAQLDATIQFRNSLSALADPPIDEIIKTGVVPYFVNFLRRIDTPQLQFEAAWVLTNIVSGTSEQTGVVVESGAVPLFIELLCNPSDELREQVAWGLGNIAGDSPKYRDIVLSNGGMTNLLTLFNEKTTIVMLRNITWTLANFCRGKPRPPFEQLKTAIPVLKWLLHIADEDILADACWALSYLSDGDINEIEAVIQAGVCGKLVEILRHRSLALISSLRTIGNLVTGNDRQTQHVVDNGALPCLLPLLTYDNKNYIIKEACWIISNITAGNQDQIQAVINEGLIPPLLWLITNAEFQIKREAVFAITNVTLRGTHKQIEYLVTQGCMEPLCDLLSCPDSKIVTICLEGLENILKVGDNEGDIDKYIILLDEADGLDKIEALQEHENSYIYEISVRILEKYLAPDAKDEGTGEILTWSM